MLLPNVFIVYSGISKSARQNYTIVNVVFAAGLFELTVPSVPTHRRLLGDAIRTRRKNAGLTQEEMAEKTGLSVIFISLLENGHRTVSVDKLLRIAKAVKTPIRDFFNGV